jgi:hypothetical protein
MPDARCPAPERALAESIACSRLFNPPAAPADGLPANRLSDRGDLQGEMLGERSGG